MALNTWGKKKMIDFDSLIKAKINIRNILTFPLAKCPHNHSNCSIYAYRTCPLAWQGECLNTFRKEWNK